MIKDKRDFHTYLKADLAAAGLTYWRPWMAFQHPLVAFLRRLRRLEYLINTKRGRIWRPYILLRRLAYREHCRRFSFTIPPNVFGPGLSLAHYGTIVVNDRARIGANCRLHVGVNIGLWGSSQGPVIGDNAYLGPGCKIFGPITLGDNVAVGANAVVQQSHPSDVTLVGVPARPLARGEDQAAWSRVETVGVRTANRKSQINYEY